MRRGHGARGEVATVGLPFTNELRDQLARLAAGEPFAWQHIGGSYDLLRRALVEAVRDDQGEDPAPLLDDCWSLLSPRTTVDQVRRFHRLDPHYAGVDVDVAWLHPNASALLATARTAVRRTPS